MSDRRYFWCDAPSPLHEELDAAQKRHTVAVASIEEMARRLGAEHFVSRGDGFVSGFVFKSQPKSGWKLAGETKSGDVYYVPMRTSREGRELARRMSMRWYETIEQALVRASGMSRDVIQGRYFCHTGAGFKDGRIFISVPAGKAECGGDKFPKIPKYMMECKEWEMQRWFDLGREGIAA